jgi:ABC-type transporter Mla subunit MlaD
MVSELVQKLGSLSSGVESAVQASLTGTQRAITGMGDNIGRLESNSKEFQEALRRAQQDAVQMFTQRVDTAAAGIGEQLAKSVNSIQTSTSGTIEVMLKNQTAAMSDLVGKLGAMSSGVEKALATSLDASTRAAAGLGEHLSKMEHFSKNYQQTVDSAQQEATRLFSEKIASMTSGLGESLQASVQMTQRTISGIEAGIGSLNAILEKLGGQQIVVQSQQPQKKGWFGRG